MPPHTKHLTRELSIRLDDDHSPHGFAPGDTIRGTVNRATHIVAPRARIVLILYGRSKCKITVNGSPATKNTETCYRSRLNFFDPATTGKVVFDGPLHIGRGAEQAVWPFAITIPLVADGKALWASRGRKTSYVPIDGADQPLPFSFAVENECSVKKLEAYVEYYLEAKLRVYSSKSQSQSATLPISIRTSTSEPPTKDSALRSRRHENYWFSSYRLVAGKEETKLSPPQKIHQFFHTRSVPCLVVDFEVESQRAIQLDNPTPIRLHLRAIPVWSQTSWDVQRTRQKIRIYSVDLWIIACTEGQGMGIFSSHRVKTADKTIIGGYKSAEADEAFLQLSPDNPTLDLGRLMNIRCRSGACSIYPAFTAFNISHGNHRLMWNIRVSLAGEKKEIFGRQPVRILPPSWDATPSVHSAGVSLLGDERTESWTGPKDGAPPPYGSTGKP